MYKLNSARDIKIGLLGTDNIELFSDLLIDHILSTTKICNNFHLETSLIPEDDTKYDEYNFIFYVTTFDKIMDEHILEQIKNISMSLMDPLNHLFIIIDKCDKLEIDDDGDLVFTDNSETDSFHKFDEHVSSFINDNLFHIFKSSISFSNIWKKNL